MVFNLAQELIDEDYHRCDVVRARLVLLAICQITDNICDDE